MATWSQVSELIQSSSKLRSAAVDSQLIKVEVTTDSGRSQIVFVGVVDDKVLFSSLICELDSVNLDALFASEALNNLIYGVGPVGGYLAIKHAQSLETIDAREIVEPIVALGYLADLYEKAITGKDAL
jgi:hypothetical protein